MAAVNQRKGRLHHRAAQPFCREGRPALKVLSVSLHWFLPWWDSNSSLTLTEYSPINPHFPVIEQRKKAQEAGGRLPVGERRRVLKMTSAEQLPDNLIRRQQHRLYKQLSHISHNYQISVRTTKCSGALYLFLISRLWCPFSFYSCCILYLSLFLLWLAWNPHNRMCFQQTFDMVELLFLSVHF